MKKGLKSNQSGQSTIEFLFAFSMTFSILFLFFKIALNTTNGYFVHYATFVASRTFLTYDGNSNAPDQDDERALGEATKAFESINVSQVIGKKPRLEANLPSEPGISKAFVGVYAHYKEKFGLSSFMGGDNLITMVSESFLGREPTRGDCVVQVCQSVGEVVGGSCELHATLYDNGC